MYCSRNDEFVKESGKCILHTPKFSWYEALEGKRIWNSDKVNAFWKVVRSDIMGKLESHSFQYVIFPAFETPHTQKSSSSHSRHQMFEAVSDFSFWKKGDNISFEKHVDFSFATFIEPATFKNVYFKEAEFTQVKAPRISFFETTLQSINFKESKIQKMHFQKSNLEKVYFDRSKLSWLMLNENFIDKLFFTKTSIHASYIHNIKEGRNIMINDSHLHTVEIKELKNSRLSVSNSILHKLHIENVVTNKLSILNNELENFIFENNRITALEVKDTALKTAFYVGTGKVSRFEINNCSMGEESDVWFSDINIKELIFKDIQNTIPLCSFEKVKIEKSFLVHNTRIETMYAQNTDFSSSKLLLSFINMNLNKAHASGVNWGVLKQERLDCDEGSLRSLYRMYTQRDEMQQANLFHHLLHKSHEEPLQAQDKKGHKRVKRDISSFLSKVDTLRQRVNVSQIKSEMQNVKNKIPKLKIEIKESEKDLFEVQVSRQKNEEELSDANAPIFKYQPDFKQSVKELLHNSCEVIGCSSLKQFVNMAK